MAKFKKMIWLQFLFLIPHIIIRALMLQSIGWEFVAIYLCGVLTVSSLVSWMILTYIKNFNVLNIIYSTLLVVILLIIIVESNFIVLCIYSISVIFTFLIWLFSKKQNTPLPFCPLVFHVFLALFILCWGWI